MKRKIVICTLLFCAVVPLVAQPTDWRAVLTDWLKAFRNEYVELSSARVKRLNINAKTRTITIYTNFAVSAVPFRPATVEQMKREAAALLAADYPNYKIEIYANGKNIESLAPNAYRATPDRSRLAQTNHQPKAFLSYPSRPYAITNGLQQRNIALWHSHGWFFDQEDGRWRWQRARYFETVEDKLTASYVLPFLLPMLENAGVMCFCRANAIRRRTKSSSITTTTMSILARSTAKLAATTISKTATQVFGNKKCVYAWRKSVRGRLVPTDADECQQRRGFCGVDSRHS